MVQAILSWGVLGTIVVVLVGVGFGVLSMRPPRYRIAEACFALAALILWARFSFWAVISTVGKKEKLGVSALVFGLSGTLLVLGLNWIEGMVPRPPTKSPLTTEPRGEEGSKESDHLGRHVVEGERLKKNRAAAVPSPSPSSAFDSTVAEWRLENQPESLELRDLFLTDFKSVQQKACGAIFVDDARRISVQYSINVDLAARSKFLSSYIGRQDQHTAEICVYLADHYRFVLDNAPQLLIEQKSAGDSRTISTKEAVFSDRIYVYHETYLPAETTVALSKHYQDRGISAIFRSVDYLSTRKLEASVRKLRGPQATH